MDTTLHIWRVFKGALGGFLEDECIRYSAALSFFALFSLAPMVLIAVQVAGFLADDINFQQQLTEQFSQLVGEKGAQGITVLMESLERKDTSLVQLVIGAAALIFSATSIFVQLQTSFNHIYSVRVKSDKSLIKQLINRLISLGMILSLGFIMIISLIIDSTIVMLESYLGIVFQGATGELVIAIQYLVLLGLVFMILYSLFNFLPDVSIKREFKVKGAAAITTLLITGKFGIGWYIGNSQFSEIGGASASIIVLMVWIYYSSMIVFFGAELIKSMARLSDVKMSPRRFAVKIKSVVVDDE